jgi:hypothetical protein
MMEQNQTHRPQPFRILVKETLDNHFADWLTDLAVIPQENGNTFLIATFTDQPALRGFLEELWNLNITVISVERIENEN